MTVRSQLLGSGAAVASARAFSLICAAVQLPLLTRFLRPDEYSAIAIATAIAIYFTLASSEPVVLGFERFPGTTYRRENYFYALRRALLYLFIASIVIMLVAVSIGQTAHAFAFVGWGIGLAVNRLISLAWLMWRQPWQYAWNLMAGTGVRTLVLVVLVLVEVDPLVSLGLAGLASGAAALIFSPRRSKSSIIDEADVTPRWTNRFGAALALGALAYTILGNANLLILATVTPKGELGAYAAMTQLGVLSSAAILNLVMSVAFPALRSAWDDGKRVLVRARLASLQSLCIAVACGVIFAFSVGDRALLRLVLPSDFIQPSLLPSLVLATALAAMGAIGSWYHQLDMRGGRVALRTGLTALVGIALTVALTLLWGATGAALAGMLGFLIYLFALNAGTSLSRVAPLIALATTVASSVVLFSGGDASVVAVGALVALVAMTILLIASRRADRRSLQT